MEANAAREMPEFISRHLSILACPACGGTLHPERNTITCTSCSASYLVTDGIPQLYAPHDGTAAKGDVTETIKQFYEANPFPNYDDFDSVASLQDKARRGVFAKLLDEQVPFGACVLEAGCGTGQLTNFLAIANRSVFGTDLCLNSLRLGKGFRDRHGLQRANFLQMNLFRPCFKRESFDLVVCNGVLHHTSDPEGGFAGLADLAKPGGYVVIGLYHRYGRLFTDLRRHVFRLARDRFQFLDPRLTDGAISAAKRKAWFMDQYKNPHESKHTIGQVLRWLRRKGLEPVRTIPGTTFTETFDQSTRLFRPARFGNRVERTLIETSWSLTRFQEGGFFIVIARKPTPAASPAG